MDIKIENLNAEPQSRLPDEKLCFNPSDPKSVDKLLSTHGPEGAYEIAQTLLKAIDEDLSWFALENGEWTAHEPRCTAMVVGSSFDKSGQCCNRKTTVVKGREVCAIHRKMLKEGKVLEFVANR